MLEGLRPEVPSREELPGPDAATFAGLDDFVALMQSVCRSGFFGGVGGSVVGLLQLVRVVSERPCCAALSRHAPFHACPSAGSAGRRRPSSGPPSNTSCPA